MTASPNRKLSWGPPELNNIQGQNASGSSSVACNLEYLKMGGKVLLVLHECKVNSLLLDTGRVWDEKCSLKSVMQILVGTWEQHKYLLWLQCRIFPLMMTKVA